MTFAKADDEVFELMSALIDEYHEHLQEARIDLRFRSEPKRKNGKVVWATAAMVSEDWQYYIPYDFIITISKPNWLYATYEQRRALLDHELSHCSGQYGAWKMRPHDIEDFVHIWERHGLWWEGAERTIDALAPIFAYMNDDGDADPEAPNETDVIDQVEAVMDGTGGGDGA